MTRQLIPRGTASRHSTCPPSCLTRLRTPLRPRPCDQDYLIVVLRKNRVSERTGQPIDEEVRYFFYSTNEWGWERADVVYFANDRCNQEKLLEQRKTGVGRCGRRRTRGSPTGRTE